MLTQPLSTPLSRLNTLISTPWIGAGGRVFQNEVDEMPRRDDSFPFPFSVWEAGDQSDAAKDPDKQVKRILSESAASDTYSHATYLLLQ